MKKMYLIFILFLVQNLNAQNKCSDIFKVTSEQKQNQSLEIEIHFTKTQVNRQNKLDKLMPDRFNLARDWGTKLLSDNDPTWKDSEYLKRIKEFMTPSITNYNGKAGDLFRDYEKLFNHFYHGQIRNIFSSGTDANNYLYVYARKNFQLIHGRDPVNMKFITFSEMYGGSYGPINDSVRKDFDYQIERPVFSPGAKLSSDKHKNLIEKENQALLKIENLLKDKTSEVGAILLEPISIVDGVSLFRTEFLFELNKLSDLYQIPIFADEIYTGGGRTGKFWAFQHYKDEKSKFEFVPDLITFGKGFGLSGIFQPSGSVEIGQYGQRIEKSSLTLHRDLFRGYYPTTTMANSLALVQSYQIVKTIWDRRLDLNADRVGQHYLKRVQQAIQFKINQAIKNNDFRNLEDYQNAMQYNTGIGFMLWYRDIFSHRKVDDDWDVLSADYRNRHSPVLTLSEEDIDWAITKKLNWKLSQ